MKIEQIYTGCLAQGAYYIESDGEAAIVDPLREVEPYITKAQKDGAKIKYVLETHFHADFVSGHIDLANKTGAEIVYGPNAAPAFPIHAAKDGEVLELGKIKIKVIHTPGHTEGGVCFVDHQHSCAFVGDTLFAGSIGRTDLPGGDTETLLSSIANSLMPLPEDTIVFPGHGPLTTIGEEQLNNPFLQ